MTQQIQELKTKQLITILLPKYFNNGSKIPSKLFNKTFEDILNLFGGYSIGNNINGAWKDSSGKVYKDINLSINIVVDSYDKFILSTLSNTLKERFKQLAIYMTIQQILVIE